MGIEPLQDCIGLYRILIRSAGGLRGWELDVRGQGFVVGFRGSGLRMN